MVGADSGWGLGGLRSRVLGKLTVDESIEGGGESKSRKCYAANLESI